MARSRGRPPVAGRRCIGPARQSIVEVDGRQIMEVDGRQIVEVDGRQIVEVDGRQIDGWPIVRRY